MTRHVYGLGNGEQAREWLAKATNRMEQELSDNRDQTQQLVTWNRRFTLELLRDEAEQLIDRNGTGTQFSSFGHSSFWLHSSFVIRHSSFSTRHELQAALSR